MRNEADVWGRLRDSLPKYLMIERIENASGSMGTWDTFVGCDERCAWIELKHTMTVRRRPKLRPGQFAFGSRLYKANLNGVYIVGSADGKVRVINSLYDGEDWKASLIETWPEMSKANVLALIKHLGLSRGNTI